MKKVTLSFILFFCFIAISFADKPQATRYDPTNGTLTIAIGSTETFTMEVTDADSDLKQYEWYWRGSYIDGGSDISGDTDYADVTNTFNTLGTYYLKGLVKDVAGNWCEVADRAVWTITVVTHVPESENSSPVTSSFNVIKGETIEFIMNTTDIGGDIDGSEWYVGGNFISGNSQLSGASATDNFSYQFNSTGTFNVVGLVYDEENDYCDNDHRAKWTITVSDINHAPTATVNSPTASQTINIGTTLTFEMDVHDDDGNLKGSEWWVTGTATSIGGVNNLSGTDALTSQQHLFNTTGTFTVTGLVYDTEDLSCDTGYEAIWTITVINHAPTASVNSPNTSQTIDVGGTLTFVMDVHDDDGNLKGSDWWVTGTGTSIGGVENLSGTDAQTSQQHTFTSTGTFTVTGQVYDTEDEYCETGFKAIWTVTVNAPGNKPEATRSDPVDENITVAVGEPQEFTLNATDQDSDLSEAKWFVDEVYIEGSSSTLSDDSGSSTFQHPFNSTGTFIVKGRVYDASGLESDSDHLAQWTVIVGNRPVAEINTPSNDQIEIAFGESVDFILYASDYDNDLSGTEWYVDNKYIDGSASSISGSPAYDNFSHTFYTSGTYAVTGIVKDTDGLWCNTSNNATWTITVKEPFRGMYLDKFNNYLGDQKLENQILNFAKNHGINSFALYSLNDNEEGHILILGDSDKEDELEAFMTKARNYYDITHISGAVGGPGTVNKINNYHNSHPEAKFDALIAECEFWRTDEDSPTWNDFVGLIQSMKTVSGIEIEVYLGKPTQNQANDIYEMVDKIFLHRYTPNINYIYISPPDKFRMRLEYFSNAVIGSQPYKKAQIIPLFSSEPEFLGDTWLSEENGLLETEERFLEKYILDNQAWQNNIVINGFQWFAYSHSYNALENLPKSSRILPNLGEFTIDVGSDQIFEMEMSDIDGNLFGYEWYVGGIYKIGDYNLSGSPINVTYSHRFDIPGVYPVKGLVVDNLGDYCINNEDNCAIWTVTVTDGTGPIIIGDEVITDSPTNAINYLNNPETNIWFKNPFTANTEINYTLTEPGYVKLYIVNQYGKLEDILIDGNRTMEQKIINWTPREKSSGIYYIILNVNGKKISSKKALYIR